MNVPRAYNYLDYRLYLQDVYEAIKKHTPRFSYRKFAALAGSSSPNYLQLITARKVNLSNSAIVTLAGNINIKPKDLHYIKLLMAFDHATTYQQKDIIYRQILKLRLNHGSRKLSQDKYEFFSRWYIPVVRELLIHRDFDGTPAWIAGRIYPRLTASKVKRAMGILLKLGLVTYDPATGTWSQTDHSVKTPSEVLSVAITNYHKAVMDAGKQALEDFSPDERDFRAVTMGIPKSRFKEIKKKTEQFWQEILESVRDDKPEEVYQLNLQLFPLTRKGKKRTR